MDQEHYNLDMTNCWLIFCASHLDGRSHVLGKILKEVYPKTVNPLDPRRKFCHYWPRECDLTADFWFFWVLAPSNHPITELEPLSTNQIPGLLSLGTLK